MSRNLDPVEAHRADYWVWIECHGAEPKRGQLLRLRDHWREINVSHFGGAMVEPYITLTTPSEPSIYGQCCAVSSWGSRLEIKLRPSLLAGTHPHLSGDPEGCWRFVLDVLTHETIHQYHREITGSTEPSYHGHGPAFTATANLMGKTIGLPPVVARNRAGSSQPRSAQWPHNVRPAGYYLGAYHSPVTASGDTPTWDAGALRILDLSETGLLADDLAFADLIPDDGGVSLAPYLVWLRRLETEVRRVRQLAQAIASAESVASNGIPITGAKP